MKISIDDSSDPACSEFVRQNPRAKLDHVPQWGQMIQRTFGHRNFYLVARDNGMVLGVLPLTQIRSRLFGNRMISQAFSDYGGPLVSSLEAQVGLFAMALELADENHCDTVEFRNAEPLLYDLQLRTDKISMMLPLVPDPDKMWHGFQSKVRNIVLKGEKGGFCVKKGGPELLDEFYQVWTIRMRQMGTPCYPRKLFQSILDTFPEHTQIFLVCSDRLVVGGAFVYRFKDTATIRWAATLPEYHELAANDVLFWNMIRHYCEEGASWIDFGHSTVNSGQHRFKKKWGSQMVQLHYQYWVRPGHEVAMPTADSPKYRNSVERWKKLPLWMTRLVGPWISTSLA